MHVVRRTRRGHPHVEAEVRTPSPRSGKSEILRKREFERQLHEWRVALQRAHRDAQAIDK